MESSKIKNLEKVRLIPYFSSHLFSIIEKTGSTNDDLKAKANLPSFLPEILMARQQTNGRGQIGKEWFSSVNQGLHFSFSGHAILEGFPLSLRSGLAVYQALRPLTEANLWLKWPNDIWIADGKLGGILTEIVANPKNRPIFVIGIGINICPLKDREFFVSDLCSAGIVIAPEDLLLRILEAWNDTWKLDDYQLVSLWTQAAERFWEMDFITGKQEFVRPTKIDAAGVLTVRTKQGALIELYSASLKPVLFNRD